MKKSLINLGSRLLEFALDTIAPPDPFIRFIEKLGHAGFMEHAQKPKGGDAFPHTIFLFSYKDKLVRAALLEIKSYGNEKIAQMIGSVAHELLISELSDLGQFDDFTSPLIVPVPMTKRCVRKRGWNQCDLIAKGISKRDKGHVFEIRPDAMRKIRETDDQVGKTRKERFENLRGCFEPDREIVRARNVIVLDDIATTGATLNEARRALLSAGAKKVLLVAIAH